MPRIDVTDPAPQPLQFDSPQLLTEHPNDTGSWVSVCTAEAEYGALSRLVGAEHGPVLAGTNRQ